MGLAERLRAVDAVLPDYAGGSLVNLAASILEAFGARREDDPPPVRGLDPELLGEVSTVVLVLVDGLGEAQLRRAIARGGVRHLADLAHGRTLTLTSIFPSTTVAALGSLDTARPPGVHGLVAYQHWLEEFGCVAQMLRWGPAERDASFMDAPWSADPRGFVPVETLDARLARAGVARFLVQPAAFKNSPLVHMLFPDSTYVPYISTSGAAVAAHRLLAARPFGEGRSFVFIYWPTLDTVAHVLGPLSAEHDAELRAIDELLIGPLRESARDDAVFLLTADHGHVALDLESAVRFEDHPELLRLLRYPPAGEHRVALLAPREGAGSAVREYCAEYFSEAIVATTDEAVALGLYGAVSGAVRQRIGDLLLIATGARQFWYTFLATELGAHRGSHGALSREEMVVPLLAWRGLTAAGARASFLP
jgi:hypothetical protein